jgi:hypothetical protein
MNRTARGGGASKRATQKFKRGHRGLKEPVPAALIPIKAPSLRLAASAGNPFANAVSERKPRDDPCDQNDDWIKHRQRLPHDTDRGLTRVRSELGRPRTVAFLQIRTVENSS